MAEPVEFMLNSSHLGWLGGEPRTFAFDEEAKFPEGWPEINNARVIDLTYQTGGLTALLDNIAAAADVMGGSFQAVLENLEDISHERPLVIVVRRADRLLADTGPAMIHFVAGWEGFTHHANGISAMYLVLETGSSAVTSSAFFPGGVVDWLSK